MTHCHTILGQLREKGYRITPQRELIIRAIAHSEEHMSAEEIFAELQKHTQATNLATVYRTLDLLWGEGLACRNDLGEGRIVYATLKHGPHIHLVCRCCNAVIEADPDLLADLKSELANRYSFAADLQHISIFGVCQACQSQNKE
jgi:Fur family transcriptional regulator, ferric uptake regulator